MFFRKKKWATMSILSPGPNVDRSRSWPCPGPARGRPACVFFRRHFWIFDFYRRKSTVLGVKKRPKTSIFEPRPQCSPKPVRGSIFFGGGRRRYENCWALVFVILQQKSTVFRVQKRPKTSMFEPRPQCSPKPVRENFGHRSTRTYGPDLGGRRPLERARPPV